MMLQYSVGVGLMMLCFGFLWILALESHPAPSQTDTRLLGPLLLAGAVLTFVPVLIWLVRWMF